MSSGTACRIRRTSSGMVEASLSAGITMESIMTALIRRPASPRARRLAASPLLPDHAAEDAVAAAEVLHELDRRRDRAEHAPELTRSHVELRGRLVGHPLDLGGAEAGHEVKRRHLEGQVLAPVFDARGLVLGLPDRS